MVPESASALLVVVSSVSKVEEELDSPLSLSERTGDSCTHR